LVYRLMDFAKSIGFPTGDGDTEEVIPGRQNLCLDVDTLKERSESRYYFDLLMLNSLKVNLTFNLSPSSNKKDTHLLRTAHNLGFTIVGFNNAPIRLNALLLRHVYGSKEDILNPMQKHYTQQALGEAYKVLGTFDFLGNPVGLFQNLATGFHDFFVEPSRGIIRSPEDFKAGLQKGTLSLVKHTVYGISNTTTKISETAARGFASMSMDNAYKSERASTIREPPANFGEGVIQGARSLRVGVSRGVSGLVMVPVREMREEGGKGLAKGIPKGIAGVIVKPIAGVIDFFSQSSQGVRNMARPTPYTTRRRPTRYFQTDGSLLIYEPGISYGQYLLHSANALPHPTILDKDEEYQFHIIWRNSTTVVYTNKRIICLADPRGIRKHWETLLSNIVSVKASDKGVKLLLKNPIGRKAYSVTKTSSLLIKCTDTSAQQYIYKKTLDMLETIRLPQNIPEDQTAGYAAR